MVMRSRLVSTVYIFFATGIGQGVAAYGQTGYMTTIDFSTFTLGNLVLGNGTVGSADAQGAYRGAITKIGDTYYAVYMCEGDDANSATWQSSIASMSAVNSTAGYPPDQALGFYEDFSTATPPDHFSFKQDSGSGGSASVGSGILTMNSGIGGLFDFFSVPQFGAGWIVETYTKQASADSHHAASVGFNSFFGQNRNAQIGTAFDGAVVDWGNTSGELDGTHYVDTAMAQAYDGSAYHYHQIYWNSTTSFSFQNDSNPKVTYSTVANIPTGTMPVGAQAYNDGTGATSTILIDYILARPYSSPEPSSSVGASRLSARWHRHSTSRSFRIGTIFPGLRCSGS